MSIYIESYVVVHFIHIANVGELPHPIPIFCLKIISVPDTEIYEAESEYKVVQPLLYI